MPGSVPAPAARRRGRHPAGGTLARCASASSRRTPGTARTRPTTTGRSSPAAWRELGHEVVILAPGAVRSRCSATDATGCGSSSAATRRPWRRRAACRWSSRWASPCRCASGGPARSVRAAGRRCGPGCGWRWRGGRYDVVDCLDVAPAGPVGAGAAREHRADGRHVVPRGAARRQGRRRPRRGHRRRSRRGSRSGCGAAPARCPASPSTSRASRRARRRCRRSSRSSRRSATAAR